MPENTAESQARAQVASIVAMVAALNLNYDRLEELRELHRSHLVETAHFERATWRETFPEEAKELEELEEAAGDNTSGDEAREAIQNDALSVEVRSDWTALGETLTPEEFRIVLCTGGPHVELVGQLDSGTPSRVRVLYQDWGTSGEYFPDTQEREALETYCAQFYFGD